MAWNTQCRAQCIEPVRRQRLTTDHLQRLQHKRRRNAHCTWRKLQSMALRDLIAGPAIQDGVPAFQPQKRLVALRTGRHRTPQGNAIDFDRHQVQSGPRNHPFDRLQRSLPTGGHQHVLVPVPLTGSAKHLEVQRQVIQWKRKQPLGIGEQLRFESGRPEALWQLAVLEDDLGTR